MQRLTSPAGATVSYDQYGSGPPLVLVNGAFSDHKTNREFVRPLFEKQFTIYAIARRGRGETDATVGHSLEDECLDVVALIQSIGEPVFLLGHSYGACSRTPYKVIAICFPFLVRCALPNNDWLLFERSTTVLA